MVFDGPGEEGGNVLSVDVVSDLVCPWCFIGKRKLERALRELADTQPDLGVAVRWHPFQLNPDLPQEGIARLAYLERKWGATHSGEIYARVTRAGEAVGIPFGFERIRIQPNTVDGHRLVAWAQAQGDANDLVERLFDAFFIEGRSLADRDELARIAAETGRSEEGARAMLASEALRDVVMAESREATDAGIDGVPCFIFNGRIAVTGAQEPEMLLRGIAAASKGA